MQIAQKRTNTVGSGSLMRKWEARVWRTLA
jgi:hypothetical protein